MNTDMSYEYCYGNEYCIKINCLAGAVLHCMKLLPTPESQSGLLVYVILAAAHNLAF